MATTHTYTFTELATAGTNVADLYRRALEAGYTNPVVVNTYSGSERALDITVDEDAVVKATLLSDIEAETAPTLSLDTSSLTVTADDVDTGTITVTDSRGAAASGKTIKLLVKELVPVDSLNVALNASGQGTFTFGPTTLRCSGCDVVFYYDANEAEQVAAVVTFS